MTFPLLLKRKDSRHEQLENDESPQESVEGDSPSFTVGLVRFEVDYSLARNQGEPAAWHTE